MPLEDANLFITLLVLSPIGLVLLIYFLMNGVRSGKDLMFLLGFLSVSLFFLVTPDPLYATRVYNETGNLNPILLLTMLGTGFLLIAVFVFRKHR